MAIVVVSLHTQSLSLDECGDFGKIWKVFGKHLGGVLSTCFDPRFVLEKRVESCLRQPPAHSYVPFTQLGAAFEGLWVWEQDCRYSLDSDQFLSGLPHLSRRGVVLTAAPFLAAAAAAALQVNVPQQKIWLTPRAPVTQWVT